MHNLTRPKVNKKNLHFLGTEDFHNWLHEAVVSLQISFNKEVGEVDFTTICESYPKARF